MSLNLDAIKKDLLEGKIAMEYKGVTVPDTARTVLTAVLKDQAAFFYEARYIDRWQLWVNDHWVDAQGIKYWTDIRDEWKD